MTTTSAPRALAALAVSAFLAFAGSACGGSTKPAESPASDGSAASEAAAVIDKPAPDLSIQTLNGKGTVSLRSLAGKIAIIDFWATWCAPCKASFPRLQEISRQNGNVQVIGISVDDSKDGVLAWAKEQGATFPIAWDEDHTLAKRWKVGKMPTTYILDASGTIRFVHDGYHEDEGDLITRELAFLSSEPPPASSPSRTELAANDRGRAPSTASDASDTSSTSASSDPAADIPAAAKPKKKGAKPAKAGGAAKPAKKKKKSG